MSFFPPRAVTEMPDKLANEQMVALFYFFLSMFSHLPRSQGDLLVW